MVELISAYDRGDETVFELSVLAATNGGAKGRGALALLVRRPAEVSAVENIEGRPIAPSGILNEYRVMIALSGDNLKQVVKMDEAKEFLAKKL